MRHITSIADLPRKEEGITQHLGDVLTSSDNVMEDEDVAFEYSPRGSTIVEEDLGLGYEWALSTPLYDDEIETPKFLVLVHEQDILYDAEVEPSTIRGGTLLALVEQLTRPDKLNSDFNDTFLLTYRCFVTARELFELLVERFQIQPPQWMAQAGCETWRDRQQQPIRIRVLNVMKIWLDDFWTEDQSEATMDLISDIYAFAKDLTTSRTPGSGDLIVVLEQRLQGQNASSKRPVCTSNQSVPTPIMPKDMKKLQFLSIDVVEYARQLTIIESTLFRKIKPAEFLNKIWEKEIIEGEPQPAPNIRALILHSNKLSNWVVEMILIQQKLKNRVAVIKHFVSIAMSCRTLDNFATLTSIIAGLGTAPIHRLKHTWDQVPARTITVLEQMRSLMSSKRGFNEYLYSLRRANPPCIPFLGLDLTNLRFIEDGIPSILKKSGLINFCKYNKTAEVIRDIQRHQNEVYALQPVPQIQQYVLSNIQATSDIDKMYARSIVSNILSL